MPSPFVGHVGPRIRTRHVVQSVETSTVVVIIAVESGDVLTVVWDTDIIGVYLVPIEQDNVCDVAEGAGVAVGRCPLPGNLGRKLTRSEKGIHQQLQVVAGRRVAMQVDAPRGLQDPVHLHQPHGHHGQVGLHPLAVGQARRFQHVGCRGLLVGNQPHPRNIKVGQRPGVLERCAGRRAAHRGGVVLVGVERRVEVNQVDALAVHPAQDVQVVAGPDRLVGKVGISHGFFQSYGWMNLAVIIISITARPHPVTVTRRGRELRSGTEFSPQRTRGFFWFLFISFFVLSVCSLVNLSQLEHP